jgi:hypothetical protein
MPHAHDPAALICHASQARDWPLVDLIARTLAENPAPPSTTAYRAYATLVQKLCLAGQDGDYDRADAGDRAARR